MRRQCGDIDVWTTLMNDERLRINDYLHTEDRERHGCPQADYLREQQLPAIGQQLKEKNIDPLIAQMVTDGCPQADGEVKSNICYWQKFNYGWHKLKTMCEVLSQCRVMA